MLGPYGLRRVRRVAGAAIDRTITSWFEWYGRIDSARGAHCLEHLAGPTTAAGAALRSLCLPGVSAIPAALGFVLESLFDVELLFPDRESEVDSTVLARDAFVFHQNLPDRRVAAALPLSGQKIGPPVSYRRQAV